MSRESLWRVIQEQAAAWAETPSFRRFSAALPRNAPHPPIGVAALLQQLQAGTAWVGQQPLRLGFTALWMLKEQPGGQRIQLDQSFTSWLHDAQSVESAHRETIAWVRSRLPGEPLQLAPQLAPGAPLTTSEFTWRIVWKSAEESNRLRSWLAPPTAASVLQAAGNDRQRLDQLARSLVDSFRGTDEWRRLSSAADGMTDDGRKSLREGQQRLTKRLADEAVAAYEPRLALRRDEFRNATVAEEIYTLTGTAREYAEAFGAADRLVETIAGLIFGQRAAYGEPMEVHEPRDLEINAGTEQTVVFNAPAWWLEAGMLVWLRDSLIRDAVQVTGFSLSLNPATGPVQRVMGIVLAGTAAEWGSATSSA